LAKEKPSPKVVWREVQVPTGADIAEMINAFAETTIPVRDKSGEVGRASALEEHGGGLLAAVEAFAHSTIDEDLVAELVDGKLVGLIVDDESVVEPAADLGSTTENFEAPPRPALTVSARS